MGLSLFKVRGGVDIEGLSMLSGSGAPGGTTFTDAAALGSFYMDSSAGTTYQKKTAGSGTDKWVSLQNQDDLDAALLGQSWRDPAQLMDATTYADIAAVVTAANVADTIDGETIAADDRVLLTDLTTGNENIYIVSGSTGNWTFTEDTNAATKGDALYVQNGTSAGQQWAYNGTTWVQQGAASATESGFIRDFVGKTAEGAENPTYSSSNVVTQSTNLEAAVGELDAEIGAAVTPVTRTTGAISDQAVNLNIDALDDAVGADADLTALTRTTGSVSLSNSVLANVDALDTAVGADSDLTVLTRTLFPLSLSNSILKNLDQLDASLGADSEWFDVNREPGTKLNKNYSVLKNLYRLNASIGANTELSAESRTKGVLYTLSAVTTNLDQLDEAIGPDITSTNVGAAGNSVNVNIGLLDAEIGSAVATAQSRTAGPISDQAVNLNIEAIDDAIGADVTSTNITTAGGTVNANISALDTEIGAAVTGTTRTVGPISDQAVNSNIEALDTAIGTDAQLSPQPRTKEPIADANSVAQNLTQLDSAIGRDLNNLIYCSNSQTVNQNLDDLDAALGDAYQEASSDTVTTATVIDSVLVDDVLTTEWTVHARSTGTATDIYTARILASHDGTAAADATNVQFNAFSEMVFGTAISGLTFTVELNGAATAQVMRLSVTSTQAVNVRVSRQVLNEV